MTSNGDTYRVFRVGGEEVRGLGSFHKTLSHNEFGEVVCWEFEKLVAASEGNGQFRDVPRPSDQAARLTNPQAGLAHDRLTRSAAGYSMPPAPTVLSVSTAAEMTELYWMAHLRDVSFDQFESDECVQVAADEIQDRFELAIEDRRDPGHLQTGIDVPGAAGSMASITPQNLFRVGLPGEEFGPMISQFFIRDATFGTQTIDQKQTPYKAGRNYLTDFKSWLDAQSLGRDAAGNDYGGSNDDSEMNFEVGVKRYISSMRDLARFVNKDALHQAYFNAALLMLSGNARWNHGNPYGDAPPPDFGNREAGFGTLGGPHILALVSEVATRALKIVWNQKWQVHLRLRPEAYGGLAHVQFIGVGDAKTKRRYGLPAWVAQTEAAKRLRKKGSLLLPMAFTAGSPKHPAYGAGHATVAGACITVLKAFFQTFDRLDDNVIVPRKLTSLIEREHPYDEGQPFTAYVTSTDGMRHPLSAADTDKLTIEGELNKLASNVAMGRSMGGVHWRTDNTRSLILGEAIAAHILADITFDLVERPRFEFRSFSRKADGQPKIISIQQGRILVDGVLVDSHSSAL